VAAHCDRRHVGALAGPPRVHHPHVVDRDRAAEFFRARLEPVAHPAVEVGQREPADAALGGAADGGGLHQLAPQALAVDAQVGHVKSANIASKSRRPSRTRTISICLPITR
jgi:hypothetical protein